MKRNFGDIVGLEELISELNANGVGITPLETSIADAIFQLTDSCVKRGYEDMDGIIERPVQGFIYNEKVATLIKTFPKAAILISGLTRDKNYGFVEKDGEVSRTGMMGDIDPIDEVREMVEAYVGDKENRKPLYKSNEEYEAHLNAERDRDWERRFGSSAGTEQELYNYNYNSFGRGR